VFAIVEHKQGRTVLEVSARRLQTIADAPVQAKGSGYRIAHQIGLQNGCQVTKPDAIWAVRLELCGQPEGQPGLSDSSRAGHRDQSIGSYPVEQSAKFESAAYEAGELGWEVAAPSKARHRHPCIKLCAPHPSSNLASRAEAELIEDLFDVPLNCPFRQEESAGNLPIGKSERYKIGNFVCPAREPRFGAHRAILYLGNDGRTTVARTRSTSIQVRTGPFDFRKARLIVSGHLSACQGVFPVFGL
jgi:hypothetical protein